VGVYGGHVPTVPSLRVSRLHLIGDSPG
jgi:hypothetical protein